MRKKKTKTMSRINNSFLWGIIFASATWSISIYLYWLLIMSGEDVTNNAQKKMSYHMNLSEKDRIKNNDKSIADLEGKNLLFDEPQSPNEKYSNNVWKIKKDRSEYQRKMLLKEVYSKKYKMKQQAEINLNFDSSLGVIKNENDIHIREEGYKLHAFNTLISQRIGFHRGLPDTRNKLCRHQTYPEKLPSASIVICFHNEHFDTLMRSVYSIIDQANKENGKVKEIILVDDFSSIDGLHEKIKEAINTINIRLCKDEEMLETNNIYDNFVDYINDDNIDELKKKPEIICKHNKGGLYIKLLKTDKREGLIRARIYGAENSAGDVLVFLDSHIEVNAQWLSPLLARLSEGVDGVKTRYSSRLVAPIIDVINPDTFEYTASPLVRGGFNWGLHFEWVALPKGTLKDDEDFIKPIKTPTIAGGLFAIYREYFNYLGKYDAGMNIWGGENLEISFRIWMCGGTMELIPCSRIGHVFRKRRPYGIDEKEDYMLANSMRMARVWMDNYVDKVIEKNPSALHVNIGDISQRLKLRKDLKCKSFQWFLDNVYPEMMTDDYKVSKKRMSALNDPEKNKFQPWYSRKRNYTDSYQIRLMNTSLCIQSEKDIKTKGGGLILSSCMRTLNQMWFETVRNEMVLGRTLCLDAKDNVTPLLGKCHELGGTQEWKHKGSAGSPIYNEALGMCLGVERGYRGEFVLMVICDNRPTNQWDFVRT